MSRRFLVSIVKLMFGLMGLAVTWVFINGMFGLHAPATPDNTITPGQTVLQRVNGQRVWQTVFSQEQINEFEALSVFVQGLGCSPDRMCQLLAETGKTGIEYRYLLDRPDALLSKVLWVGGFIDPGSGLVFDLFGRPYKADAYVRAITQVPTVMPMLVESPHPG